MRKTILSTVAALVLAAGLTGCATEPLNVPADARTVVEGERALQYTAPYTGEVYVYNVSDKAVVYSGEIDEGDVLLVDPEANRITLDGNVAMEKGLDRGDQYRVFYKRTGEVEREVRIQETRTEKVTEGQ